MFVGRVDVDVVWADGDNVEVRKGVGKEGAFETAVDNHRRKGFAGLGLPNGGHRVQQGRGLPCRPRRVGAGCIGGAAEEVDQPSHPSAEHVSGGVVVASDEEDEGQRLVRGRCDAEVERGIDRAGDRAVHRDDAGWRCGKDAEYAGFGIGVEDRRFNRVGLREVEGEGHAPIPFPGDGAEGVLQRVDGLIESHAFARCDEQGGFGRGWNRVVPFAAL